MATNTKPSNIDEYIKLYTQIFVVDAPEKDKGIDTNTNKGADIEKEKEIEKENEKNRVAIDLSKLKVPSIYANFSGQGIIQRNGLNIGDGYSYVDFKKHKDTGDISFYRRGPDKSLLHMEYILSNKTLYAIVNGKRHKIGAIIDELQQVFDQITAM